MSVRHIQGQLILVVDDEERMVRFIRLNLEQDGFQVIAAYNGIDALDQIRSELPNLVLLQIEFFFALLHFVEGRLSNVEIAIVDKLWVLPKEEGEQERTNVRSVDISIRHDDDAVVTKFVEVLLDANTTAQGGNQCRNLLGLEHLVKACSLNI